MKSFLWDLLILSAISAIVVAIMFLPRKTKCRLEKNWGQVFYDAPITKDQATKVLNTLVDAGVYNGEQVLAHTLRKVGGSSGQPETIIWAMMYAHNYREVVGDEIVRGAIGQLHAHVFPNKSLTVEFTDKIIATDNATNKIDQDWGAIFFDSPIASQDARRFTEAVTSAGGYDGSMHMVQRGRGITYRVERAPSSLETARDLLADQMRVLTRSTFPDDQVQVVLIDKDFEQFEVLVEPAESKSESGE